MSLQSEDGGLDAAIRERQRDLEDGAGKSARSMALLPALQPAHRTIVNQLQLGSFEGSFDFKDVSPEALELLQTSGDLLRHRATASC